MKKSDKGRVNQIPTTSGLGSPLVTDHNGPTGRELLPFTLSSPALLSVCEFIHKTKISPRIWLKLRFL